MPHDEAGEKAAGPTLPHRLNGVTSQRAAPEAEPLQEQAEPFPDAAARVNGPLRSPLASTAHNGVSEAGPAPETAVSESGAPQSLQPPSRTVDRSRMPAPDPAEPAGSRQSAGAVPALAEDPDPLRGPARRRGWLQSLLGPFGKRSRRHTVHPDARPGPPGRDLQLAEANGGIAPVATSRNRRAIKPLPWGRDFAATVIHREDTLTAIFGKLDAADSPRVALVAPRGNAELAKTLGMRRLRRYVDMTGKDVMLVTHSGAIRSRAREVGLAAVGNIRKVDFERYGRGGMRVGGVIVPLPGLGLFLRLTAFALVVAGLSAVVLLYLPKASVQVYPQLQSLTDTPDVTLTADAATGKPGEVPAHRRSQTITRTVQFPVHGQTTVKGPDGNDQNVPAPSDDDIKAAGAFAQQVLLDQGRQTLQERYKGETLFQQSAILSALDVKTNVKAGEAAELLDVTASAQVTMLSADNDALRSVLEQDLKAKVDRNQMFVPETFKSTVVSAGTFDKNNNRLPVRLNLTESSTRAFSVSRLQKALAGKNRTDAQQAIVDRVDLTQPARIKLEPGWAPWLPRFTSRIAVSVRDAPPPDTTAGSRPTGSVTPTPKPQ